MVCIFIHALLCRLAKVQQNCVHKVPVILRYNLQRASQKPYGHRILVM